MVRRLYVALFAAAASLAAPLSCARETRAAPSAAPEQLVPRIVRSYPHDPLAFTQGLQVFEGKVYESTGLVGRSSVRRVDLVSGAVERQVAVPPPAFAEGLTRVGGRLYQLTWQDGRLLIWNLSTLKKERELAYQGEGWGLCFDGRHLVMSDGSDRLAVRDPETFAKVRDIDVRAQGRPVANLNELECVGGTVFANVWQTNEIVRIDGKSGQVTAIIDASNLLRPEERANTDVLNGIAHLPDTGRFLLTGKLWPRTFEVEFVKKEIAR